MNEDSNEIVMVKTNVFRVHIITSNVWPLPEGGDFEVPQLRDQSNANFDRSTMLDQSYHRKFTLADHKIRNINCV